MKGVKKDPDTERKSGNKPPCPPPATPALPQNRGGCKPIETEYSSTQYTTYRIRKSRFTNMGEDRFYIQKRVSYFFFWHRWKNVDYYIDASNMGRRLFVSVGQARDYIEDKIEHKRQSQQDEPIVLEI